MENEPVKKREKMEKRVNPYQQTSSMKALYGFISYLNHCSIEQFLLHLICMRVSQINGCAYCIDMHSKELRACGESEQRLYLLDVWRQTALFSGRERAALAWAECLTLIPSTQVTDELYRDVSAVFTEQELVDLTLGVTTINTYNRIDIAFRIPIGDFQPSSVNDKTSATHF